MGGGSWVNGRSLGNSWAFRGLGPHAWSMGQRPRAPRAGVRPHGNTSVFSHSPAPGGPGLHDIILNSSRPARAQLSVPLDKCGN